jgi:hypothetical protein
MRTKDAIAAGDTPQRLLVLSAWRDAPFYSERERAALAWTEAVTQLGPSGVSDELYRATRQQFDERQLVDLTMAIVAINGWNRLAIAFHSPEVGSHVPLARSILGTTASRPSRSRAVRVSRAPNHGRLILAYKAASSRATTSPSDSSHGLERAHRRHEIGSR